MYACEKWNSFDSLQIFRSSLSLLKKSDADKIVLVICGTNIWSSEFSRAISWKVAPEPSKSLQKLQKENGTHFSLLSHSLCRCSTVFVNIFLLLYFCLSGRVMIVSQHSAVHVYKS